MESKATIINIITAPNKMLRSKKNTGTSIVGIRPSALGLGKLESVFDPKTKGRIKMFFLSSFYH